MEATLFPGACAMLRAASSVLPGVELPDAAAVKSAEQALPLLEAVHEVRALASVFSFFVETLRVAGMPAPGDTPVPGFTRSLAVAKALSSPVVFVQLAPTFPPGDINEDSAQTEAVVVASLTTKVLPALMLPQGPSAVIIQMDGFVGPEPNWPPFERR